MGWSGINNVSITITSPCCGETQCNRSTKKILLQSYSQTA